MYPPCNATFHEPPNGRMLILWKARCLSLVGHSMGESGKSTFYFCAVANNKPGFLELDQLLEHGRTSGTHELCQSVISST